MKVIMINDCAFVGETLIKYFPSEVEAVHLRRSRGPWDKTFGVAWKILRAKGDIYHVNYLLQDCYVASRLGKRPLVGHAHGSDLRLGLKHWAWARIVRHNLKHCRKVLVSTPDLIGFAKQYRADAEYLPNPIDTSLFYPKAVEQHDGKLGVLVASACDWKIKGTDMAIRALSELKESIEVSIICYGRDIEKTLALAESLGLRLNLLPKVSHQGLREYYWKADVVLDQFTYGVLGMAALEAISCGRPVITYASSEYKELADFPLKDANTTEKIAEALKTSEEIREKEYNYLMKYHSPEKVAKNVARIYAELLGV